MKQKRILFPIILCLFLFLCISASSPCYARFRSHAELTGKLDTVKSAGEVKLYHPEWIYGYNTETETFDVNTVPILFNNIHISVSNEMLRNKVENGTTVETSVVNERETEYYLRVVSTDGAALPIEYDIHEYADPSSVFDYQDGIGYGPFTLTANTPHTSYYSLKANWVSTELSHLLKRPDMEVQMVIPRPDGSLYVFNRCKLPIEFVAKINLTVHYYQQGTVTPLGSETVSVLRGSTVDFTDQKQLGSLGIHIPDGYSFYQATSPLTSWAAANKITIPADATADQTVELYCTKDKAKVTAHIYNANTKSFLSEVEIPLDASGNVALTVDKIRALNPALASKSSFTVGIINGENIYGIGNPYTDGTVTVNYKTVYNGGYSLKLDNMHLYIGYWW